MTPPRGNLPIGFDLVCILVFRNVDLVKDGVGTGGERFLYTMFVPSPSSFPLAAAPEIDFASPGGKLRNKRGRERVTESAVPAKNRGGREHPLSSFLSCLFFSGQKIRDQPSILWCHLDLLRAFSFFFAAAAVPPKNRSMVGSFVHTRSPHQHTCKRKRREGYKYFWVLIPLEGTAKQRYP